MNMDATPTERVTWQMLAVVIAFMVGLVGGIILMDVTEDTVPAVCHSVTEEGPMLDCDYSNGTWYPTEEIDKVEVER